MFNNDDNDDYDVDDDDEGVLGVSYCGLPPRADDRVILTYDVLVDRSPIFLLDMR